MYITLKNFIIFTQGIVFGVCIIYMLRFGFLIYPALLMVTSLITFILIDEKMKSGIDKTKLIIGLIILIFILMVGIFLFTFVQMFFWFFVFGVLAGFILTFIHKAKKQ